MKVSVYLEIDAHNYPLQPLSKSVQNLSLVPHTPHSSLIFCPNNNAHFNDLVITYKHTQTGFSLP